MTCATAVSAVASPEAFHMEVTQADMLLAASLFPDVSAVQIALLCRGRRLALGWVIVRARRAVLEPVRAVAQPPTIEPPRARPDLAARDVEEVMAELTPSPTRCTAVSTCVSRNSRPSTATPTCASIRSPASCDNPTASPCSTSLSGMRSCGSPCRTNHRCFASPSARKRSRRTHACRRP